jgi:hypothetical protein
VKVVEKITSFAVAHTLAFPSHIIPRRYRNPNKSTPQSSIALRPDQSISLVSDHWAPSLGSLEDRRGYCYDFTPFQFRYFFLPFPTLLYLSMLSLAIYSYTLTHMQHDYSSACSCAYSSSALITNVLTHAQLCLLIYAYFAYSYTVVVQYIRTGWTPLFGS